MKSFLFKACGAALAAACLGGVSGMLRAQQAPARPGASETRAQGESRAQSAEARVEALRSSDPLKRAAAAYELSKRPAEARAAIDVLLELLSDATVVDPGVYRRQDRMNSPYTNTTVGEEAAHALTVAGAEAVAPLIAALGRAEGEARRNAAWALGAIDDRRAVEPLTKTLGADADARVREQAAWALGALGDRSASEAVARALADESAEVRQQAAWAAGALGDRRAVERLVAALSDSAAGVREQAAWALGAV
ncbi:MAG TPA: HEAT repeat domain-containing protein, partial [Pyrinomonadaceae bacterium]|nr:HEAT repeat domain-containing protein [Pyrinomonadaceae bacterium]